MSRWHCLVYIVVFIHTLKGQVTRGKVKDQDLSDLWRRRKYSIEQSLKGQDIAFQWLRNT